MSWGRALVFENKNGRGLIASAIQYHKTVFKYCYLWVFWQREKDSNPHKQSQSLSCYPYTIPLFRTRYRGHE